MNAPPALLLFRRWRPLLDGLAAEIHPLRWKAAGVGETAAVKLASNPRAGRRLSLRLDWLNRPEPGGDGSRRAWPDCAAWEKFGAAALLSGTDLLGSGLRLGAALFRPGIARLVLGKDVAAFKAAVGGDAYRFAMRQAVLVKEIGFLSPDRVGERALPEAVVRAGGLSLAAWLDFLPADLGSRVILKLPPDVDALRTETAVWSEEERRRWRAALERVFSLI